jgi:hypothetical protein
MSSIVPLLGELTSVNNSIRIDAEQRFNSLLESQTSASFGHLTQCFANKSIDINCRSFAGVLLRRAIERFGAKLPPSDIMQMRALLMKMWTYEANHIILKRLSHVIAQSAVSPSWSELLPEIINFSTTTPSSNQQQLLPSILNLIEVISEYCPDEIIRHLPQLSQYLAVHLSSENASIQVACAKATGACIISIEDDNARDTFKAALQPILSVLGVALTRGDEIDATSIMEHLVTIAQMQPIFFKGSLDSVVSAMLTVAGSSGLEFSTRSMALELMVTLTESAPALARKCPGLVQGLIPLAMSLMLEVEEDDEEWARGKYVEEVPDENSAVGDEAIERVAAGMGGKAVAEPVLSIVQMYAADSQWQRRRAAVAGLGRLAEGSTKHFKKFYNQAVDFLVKAVQDPSHRVKFEAIQSIGRFASLYPDTQCALIDTFLPALASLLQSPNECDRTRGHCASALINMLNPDGACDEEFLAKYLDPLLGGILTCFQSAPQEVQAPCLVLIGVIAQVIGDGFARFYSSFMPGIKGVIQASATLTSTALAASPGLQSLRGKAMECAGLVGEAVGAELFFTDAREIMQLFINAMSGQDSDKDTSTFEHILPACARISKALGVHFEPFLPAVMDPLLRGANQATEFSMVDAEEGDEVGDVEQDEEGIETAVVNLGGGVKKRVTLNTHMLQQKNQAARILYEFAVGMKGHLKGYIVPSLQSLLTLVRDKHSADLRASAALAIAKMFDASIHAVQCGYPISASPNAPTPAQELEVVMNSVLGQLLEAIKKETAETSRSCAAESFRDVLQACYQSGTQTADGNYAGSMVRPSLETAQILIKEVLQQCGDSLRRRKEVEASAVQGGDRFEAEDRQAELEEQLEEEDDLLSSLADSIGQLLKTFGPEIMGCFDSFVAPAFAPYLVNTAPQALQTVAVCLVDDAIEFGGDAGHKYIQSLLPTLMGNFASDHTVLQQSSVYGVAKAVLVSPSVIEPYIPMLVPALFGVLVRIHEREDDDKEEDTQGVTENAIFALGSLCANPAYRGALAVLPLSQACPLDTAGLVGLWLKNLPFKADEIEAKTASRQLCDLLESGDSVVSGTGDNLQEVLRIMAEVFQAHTERTADEQRAMQTCGIAPSSSDEQACYAHPVTLARMRAIVRVMLSSAEMQAALGALTPEMLQVLQTAAAST